MESSNQSTVLVTGASGFIAMHCVLQLLEQGYRVRGTVRSLAREEHLRHIISKHVQADDRLEFVCADLTDDTGWQSAADGCKYVLHLASPFPAEQPEDENEVIVPAREGTLRVLRAAAECGVNRVVLTSSLAAIMYGYTNRDKVFDESDWSNLDGKIDPYPKSKTIAERAAWDFIQNQKSPSPLELSVINPGFVQGPLLDGTHYGTSADTIRRLMTGKIPGIPRTMFGIVDVRDVATAHLAAMVRPQANGNRYLCVSGALWFVEIARILQENFADQGYRIPGRQMPDSFVRIFALFDKSARSILDGLGQEVKFTNQKIIEDLGWQPKSAEEAIVAMGASLIHLGVV
jgi:nucleoside-diphosphate-sugar epimerase